MAIQEKPQHGDRRELFGGEEKAGKFRRENLDYANRFEDRELRLLEKQMHIKKNKNKLPKCFAEDGLDCKYIPGAVSVCACVHACLCACMRVCVRACVCVHACACACMHACSILYSVRVIVYVLCVLTHAFFLKWLIYIYILCTISVRSCWQFSSHKIAWRIIRKVWSLT